jgi:hypothetical protein
MCFADLRICIAIINHNNYILSVIFQHQCNFISSRVLKLIIVFSILTYFPVINRSYIREC